MTSQHHNLNTQWPIYDYRSQFLSWNTPQPLWIHAYPYQVHLHQHHETIQSCLSCSQGPRCCWNLKGNVCPSPSQNSCQQEPRKTIFRLRIPSSQAHPGYVHTRMAPHHFLPWSWWIWHQIQMKITRQPPHVCTYHSIINYHWLGRHQILWSHNGTGLTERYSRHLLTRLW